ncbi:MAG: hypothetical protein H6656_06750 [Ardenticatenaceae bacterium]|nr:hypothetical protein [Anaerolineales bacterium]MCB9007045.1 hypothetical protein [Ardenticatenaceae bacterium]
MRLLRLLLIIALGGLLAACSNPTPDDVSPLTELPVPTAPVIPATFTAAPPDSQFNPIPVVTVTQAPLPTQETSTPIPFGANVVELRLSIPTLGYDRRLQGSVNSQIILVDESNGFAIQRDNQASVLLDLQQVLPELVLEPVPDGCETCVNFSYSLPFSGVQGEGWLRDAVLLASLENYFTITLGPHFPEGTIVGLRRSASPYAPAQTVAVSADGRLYRWLANEAEAAPVGAASPALTAAFAGLDVQPLAQQYAAPCPGSPLESLFLAGREDERLIALVCPEYALPAALQPIYVALDTALEPLLAESDAALPRPPAGFPLDAVLDYQRVDGARLTILMDDTAVVTSGTSQPITTTLGSSQVISLTTSLLASGSLRTGLTTYLPAEDDTAATATPNAPRSLLLVRGPAGVYDAQWFNTADVPVLAELNDLLNQLLLDGTAVPTPTQAATPAGTETATAVASPSATPADE